MSTFSSVHFDGVLWAVNLKAGLLDTPGQPSPVVSFQVIAGVQAHPVWALDRLAVVVYCYCLAARRVSRSETGEFIQVNVQGTLVSNNHTSVTVASSIQWHTSKLARNLAERRIAEMLLGRNGTPKDWPLERLSLPVSRSDMPQKYRGAK